MTPEPGDYVLAALTCGVVGSLFFLAAGFTALITAICRARRTPGQP